MQLTTSNSDEKIKDKIILAIFISKLGFLTLEEKNFLYKNIDSSSQLALISIEEIEFLIKRKINLKKVFDIKENLRCSRISASKTISMHLGILLNTDFEYPQMLREFPDSPFMLFFRGNVSCLCEKSVSVVGTRRLTPEGKIAARQFAYDAASDGVNVISGLAYGADAFSHKGALDAWFDCKEKNGDLEKIGKTIAVLPCPADEITPKGNAGIAEKIIKTGGCLISEYECGSGSPAWHFVKRNRIVAALSPATVVIQAPAGSGALITADFALDSGRDVMFHSACFCENAELVNKKSEIQLAEAFNKKQVSRYKMENTVRKFTESGAPVIESYEDYKKAVIEAPGRIKNDLQSDLGF